MRADFEPGTLNDKEPGFWPSYAPPKNNVSALAQGPFYKIDGDALCNAIYRDWQKERHGHKQVLRQSEGQTQTPENEGHDPVVACDANLEPVLHDHRSRQLRETTEAS